MRLSVFNTFIDIQILEFSDVFQPVSEHLRWAADKKFIQKTINRDYENIFTIARNGYSDGRNSLV